MAVAYIQLLLLRHQPDEGLCKCGHTVAHKPLLSHTQTHPWLSKCELMCRVIFGGGTEIIQHEDDTYLLEV